MFDYEMLDPGIRETVRWVHSMGFRTSDSGDGVSKVGTDGDGCMIPRPNVVIVCDRDTLLDDADRLHEALVATGIKIGEGIEELAQYCDVSQLEPTDGVTLEANYSPHDGISYLLLLGLDDELLKRCTAGGRRDF